MIPLRDSVPSGSVPVVTILLIVTNCFVWLYELSLGGHVNRFVFEHGLIPLRFITFYRYEGGFIDNAFIPTVTSLFLHGGWLHLIGNNWFLWVFGDNVEDRIGHFNFLCFYLLCGIAAGFVQVFFGPFSRAPIIGASGAVSGVLGAYLISFPRAMISTLFIIIIVRIPAFIFLIYWFAFQFLSGASELGSQYADASGGVAYWAHIGGFIIGIILLGFFPKKPYRQFPSRFEEYRRVPGPFD